MRSRKKVGGQEIEGKVIPFPAISRNRKKITNRKIDIPINHKEANRNA
jgi:hypothetical protein